MVAIHDILKIIVNSLPPLDIEGTEYPIYFFDGILDDAKEQINKRKAAGLFPYPCVWLLRDFMEVKDKNRVKINSLRINLLIDTKNDYQTPERLQTRIDPYLILVKKQLVNGLKKAGVLVETESTTRLTFLGSPSTDAASKNTRINSRIFGDYLDGVQLLTNVSYQCDLKLTCYEY